MTALLGALSVLISPAYGLAAMVGVIAISKREPSLIAARRTPSSVAKVPTPGSFVALIP